MYVSSFPRAGYNTASTKDSARKGLTCKTTPRRLHLFKEEDMRICLRRFLLLIAYCTCAAISGIKLVSDVLAVANTVNELDSIMFTGVQCQSFSPPTEDICLGDNITYTYTCVVVNSMATFSTVWTLTSSGTESQCLVLYSRPDIMQTCGPGRVFTSSLTGQSGDNTSFTSTLSVKSISESLNGTTVECEDAMMNTVGSMGICILGKKIHVYVVNTCTC